MKAMLSTREFHGRAASSRCRAGAWSVWAWPGTALAQGAADSALGPWIFASVAIVVVAILGWLAGRRAASPARSSADTAPPSSTTDAANGLASKGDGDPVRSIEALCAEWPGASRVYRRPAGGAGWQLVAAQPRLAAGSGPFDGLPPAVAAAAGGLASDGRAEIDGWQLQASGRDAGERLVVRHAPQMATPEDDTAAFSFTVSHDLRAPVRVVEGFARILKEDYGRQLDRIGNDHLDRVLASAARMNAMIDAMLSLARLSSQPIARQPVNLSQLVGFVVDDLRRSAPERVVHCEIESGQQVVGDPTLLRQVLENLLSNAWKYTARTAQARVSFGSAEIDGRRVFVVRDNGAGFDMRSADRLFGPFQRLHSANDFPGTGVGLASVQRIVRRHGGTVWAEAEPGKGASFYFTLLP